VNLLLKGEKDRATQNRLFDKNQAILELKAVE
jgi:hypothetical protein